MTTTPPDISIALNIKLTPSEIQIKENTPDIYIGTYLYNQKTFLRSISYTHLFTRTLSLLPIAIELTEPELLNKYFRNYSHIGNGYDIASLLILFICLFIGCFFPFVGRRLRKLLFFFICFCYFYLFFFVLRISKKEYVNLSEVFITVFFVMFFSSFALVVNVLSFKKRFDPLKGVCISFFLIFGVLVFEVFFIELFDPYLWQLGLYLFFGVLYSFYLNLDCFFMLKRRPNYFLIGDWFLGYAHLETDFSLRFWRDLFFRKDFYDDDNLSDISPVNESSVKNEKTEDHK